MLTFLEMFGVGKVEHLNSLARWKDNNPVKTLQTPIGVDTYGDDFYLDLRRYGSVRHAGFGLGFERCVMYLTGMGNIRDVLPFPRTVNNCEL